MSPYAMEFTQLFGAFEYALKRGGLYCQGKKWKTGKPATADWKTFALMLPADFFAKARLDSAARYLVERPPRQFVIGPENGPPIWRDAPPPSTDAPTLVEHLKDVRNNFFHGDKTAAERDIELLVAGIAVLRLMRSSTRDMAGLKSFHQYLTEVVGPAPKATA